ncbi:type IV secretory system conjugative DNA transfer family protein [Steroidobacter agaridevorans]|uniref:type IV secretory system conjugative DNA transfer family protein n=1 Tax=Steroidobacter agaridevorans TaxID=2695856 RepID=UPI001329F6E3|nr:type IV secretory system conjugative DNA transfer family protein [Steroidobacter agaridevorans]GFE87298.1 protein VirD4 [Steroidobacter agaridevorans]
MIPLVNAATWPPRTNVRATRRLARATVLGGGALVLSQYLAGYAFLWSVGADPRAATPLTIARYAYYFSDRADIALRLKVASAIGVLVIVVAALPALLPRKRALHGNATFATRREMARAGLFSTSGFYLGRVGRRDLVLGGQQGVLLSAPPRSDKGTAIVIPNLLTWPGSVVCLDLKIENWTISAGYRQRCGQDVFLFDPLNEAGDTACWNCLSYVSADPNLRINDVQHIAAILYPEIPGTDPFWSAGARSLFLGITLFVLETPSLPPTLGEVLRQGMASDSEGFSHHWKRIIEGRQSGRFALSQPCVRALSDVIDLAPVTASSIRKTFTSRLDLLANPLLDRATSRNDFDLRELRRRPMSIYIGIRPADLHRLKPLLNLFIEQAIGLQTKTLPEHDSSLRYQVAMILDEAPAIGRIPILAESIAYLPGFNVRILLVVQALSQLRDVYGAQTAETMMKSLAVRIAYAPKDFAEANELSQELGNTTVRVKSYSRPLGDLFERQGRRGRTVNISEQRRPLMLPQEIKELGRDHEIVIYEGLRPILARKNRYFEDPRLRVRLHPPPARASPHPAPVVAASENDAPLTQEEGVIETSAPAAKPVRRRASRRREARVEDLERIDELTLDDFDVDWSRVELPQKPEGERLTSEELHRAVNSFLTTIRER